MVPAISLNEAIRFTRSAPVDGLAPEAIRGVGEGRLAPGGSHAHRWPQRHASGHQPRQLPPQGCRPGRKHPNDLPQFRWINTLLGNLKTSLSGTFHAFNFDKYARRYLGGYCFRFNRRFSMAAMTERIANAVCCCLPCTERGLRLAELYG